jgi:peptidoglycan/xylan/chitin deacetylase (PgdA/CDA1 family)
VFRPTAALLLCLGLACACGGGVPILMYHSVSESGGPLTVPPRELEGHLDFLRSAGFATVTLRDVLDAQDGRRELPRHPIVLTFDDGYDDALSEVLPRLQARGQKGTFFIVSGFCAHDAAHRVSRSGRSHLTWPEVIALRDAGMEIGSHTVSHRNLTSLPMADLRAELEHSRAVLQEYLGAPVEFFAYPYNLHMRWVRRAVERAGYRGAVVGAKGNSDPLTLQRLTMHRGITPDELRSMLEETWQTDYTGGG